MVGGLAPPAFPRMSLNLIFFVKENEKGEVLENDIVFEDLLLPDFIAYFLFFFFLRKKKVRESRRKEQKEERLQSVFTL